MVVNFQLRTVIVALGTLALPGVPCPVAAQEVGFVISTPADGSAMAAGSALFAYRNADGVLVSEAGVGAAQPVTAGRIFVDQDGTLTAVAFANPGSEAATATLELRDADGVQIDALPLPIAARGQTARFVSELFPGVPDGFVGTLTFVSDVPLTAITLRQTDNQFGEPLYTTLPIVDLDQVEERATVFPHIAIGGGWVTQLILINPGSETLGGEIRIYKSDGTPLVTDTVVGDFRYEVPPNGVYRIELGSAEPVAAGQAKLTPDAGQRAPAGTAVFQFYAGANLITEVAAAAEPTTSLFRIVVDYIGTRTGIAVANPGDAPADLTITLRDRYGDVESTITRNLPARNHLPIFVDELFGSVADGYSGLLEVSSTQLVVPVTLKLTTNSRGDAVLTTLPVADLTRPPTGGFAVFPHIALGGGFTTRLILLNSSTATAADGSFEFFAPDGGALSVPMWTETASEFEYQLVSGGGQQFYPGNSADISSVSLLDAPAGQVTDEIVINQGNSLRPRLEIVDENGTLRDDYYPSITSLDSAIASVESGRITGEQAGFATLTITVGNRLISAIATVVDVQNGAGGFEITGIAQDTARRLYLTSAGDHSVLLADGLTALPEVYAGILGSSGLVDDQRNQAKFNQPSFLALNQATGSLYVADTANHVIRLVGSGQNGVVSTLAGNGTPGSGDGSLAGATFRNPQGVALDGRGNLWVADTGNHTIRRINLVTGQVETIAGEAGASGSSDGPGTSARFNAPVGLAIEAESTASQLERQWRGDAPPPVTVLVADSGNGLIRRVDETGQVETVGSVASSLSTVSSFSIDGPTSTASVTPTFSSPTAIAIDASGNIFVSEAGSGEIRTLLRTGVLVSAVEPGTFTNPTGIAIAEDGRVIVADSEQGAQQLSYGAPEITSVSPEAIGSLGGETIEVAGRNFAPDTVVILAGVVVTDPTISDTRTLSFEAPALPSGRTTLTLSHRGGLAQSPLVVRPIPLTELEAGYITTVAGGSTFAGEGEPATDVPMSPYGLAIDDAGNIYVADLSNRRVRRIDARTGRVTTVAGTGGQILFGINGDGDLAIAAAFDEPDGVAFDRAGNLLVSDGDIRRVEAASGNITTVVDGEYGLCDEGVPPSGFASISGFAIKSDGDMFISDLNNRRIRLFNAETNELTTIAGSCTRGFDGDGGLAVEALLDSPFGLAIDEGRNVLYIADSGNHRIRRIDLSTETISTFAGGGSVSEGVGDGQPATSAVLDEPIGLAIDASGNLFIADRGGSADGPRVRRVDIGTGVITTVAGSGAYGADGDGGPATSASFNDPWAVAVDGAGSVIVADFTGYVRRIDRTGTIDLVAGNQEQLVVEDGVAATATTLHGPAGVSVDALGNLFITDQGSELIRRVDAATQFITTFAGGGKPESGIGDGGSATDAALSTPSGHVAIDDEGNVYLADRFNYRVRRVDALTGDITTVAGNGINDSSGDGGQATDAAVLPDDLALDAQGNLYIAQDATGTIRRVNLDSGIISTVAGGGTEDDPGDGSAAIEVVLRGSLRIAVDPNDDLYISDYPDSGPGRIWRVDISTETIATFVGGGDSFEENRLATDVTIFPQGIAFDTDGNLYITDYNYPYGIRKVDGQTQMITTVAGDDGSELGDNGPAREAALFYAKDVAVDASGNLYIATSDDRIRAVRAPLD